MLYQSQVHVNLMIRPNGYISVQTFTNRCVKCGLLHHEPQNGNGCKVPTIIRARVRGKCVQCMGVIEVHDLIARGPGSWMHASQAKQCVARALHPDPKEYVNPQVSRRPPLGDASVSHGTANSFQTPVDAHRVHTHQAVAMPAQSPAHHHTAPGCNGGAQGATRVPSPPFRAMCCCPPRAVQEMPWYTERLCMHKEPHIHIHNA